MRDGFRLDIDFGEQRCEFVVGEGVLADVGPKTARLVTSPVCVLVTDSNLTQTPHVAAVEASLRRAGLAPATISVPAGEATKSADSATVLWEAFAEARLESDGVVIALGGGVVGDLAGFCAATWMRGVATVQVPTTVLAMCDSGIGGKTGINLAAGKNLVGAFHQPRFVLADTGTLRTLPDREFCSGFAEVVKCALLRDRMSLARLTAAAPALMAREPAAMADAVRLAVEVKAEHVRGDFTDRAGRRALLNLGHTTGHAIETEAGYGHVLHGEAVAAGIVVAARIAQARGFCGADLVGEIRTALVAFRLPTTPPADLAHARIVARTEHDKKRRGARRRMVLPHARGGADLYDVDDVELLAALAG